MSFTRLLYHIVFRTKNSNLTIPIAHEKELYNYIWGFVKNKKSLLYQVGGMPDHIHLLIDLHPDIALSAFVHDLKIVCSKWLKSNPNFPDFDGWGESYAAFSYSLDTLESVKEYIHNQKNHHIKMSFADEFHSFLAQNNIAVDIDFLK